MIGINRTQLIFIFITFITLAKCEPPNLKECKDKFMDKDYFWKPGCDRLWHLNQSCSSDVAPQYDQTYANLILMNAAYCQNDGTGLCKGISGRFEYQFNSFKDEIVGPFGSVSTGNDNTLVDQFGYHKRVPVSYNINGKINYVDRSINWARKWAKEHSSNKPINIMSIKDFNWCAFVEKDLWPYTSSIIDHASQGRYHLYFFNRQTCIIDTTTGKARHFNTRFVYDPLYLVERQYNPTIFAMQDNKLSNKIMLVKHFRQSWYETSYQVVDKEGEADSMMALKQDQVPNGIITDARPILLSAKSFAKFANNTCIFDFDMGDRNKYLSGYLSGYCGMEQVEVADREPIMQSSSDYDHMIIEVTTNNHPMQVIARHYMLGRSAISEQQASTVFSAATSVPINGEYIRAIQLFAQYDTRKNTEFDEYYPVPYLSDFKMNVRNNTESPCYPLFYENERLEHAKELRNFNFVDDFAYLYGCQTILVIFGPLYSEFPVNDFSLQAKAPVGSIYDLGIWELAKAFFSESKQNVLWVYHRTNYVAMYRYTCGSGDNKLVTAKREGNYHYRHGPNQPKWATFESKNSKVPYSEEMIFKDLGVFKGSIDPIEPPNPDKYMGELDGVEASGPESPSGTWVWVVVLAGILIIVGLCLICMASLRRRHRHMYNRALASKAPISSQGTRRSSMSSSPSRGIDAHPTLRSSIFDSSRSRSSGGSRPSSSRRSSSIPISSRQSSSRMAGSRPSVRSSLQSIRTRPTRSGASSAPTFRTMRSGRSSGSSKPLAS